MKRLIVIIAAITAITVSCNPSHKSTTNSNFPNSTTDTATTNNIPNPDSTHHR